MEDLRPLQRRWLRGWQLVGVDVVIAVVLTLVCGYAALEPRPEQFGPVAEAPLVSWVIAAAIGLPVAARRRWPVPVLGAVLCASVLAIVAGLIPIFAAIPPFVALALVLYPMALVEPRGRSISALVVSLVATAATFVITAVVAPAESWSDTVGLIPIIMLMLGSSWAMGRAVRAQRAYLNRSARQLAAQAVTEERLRIARELHDIVAHSLSVIAVKAGIANHVAHERPAEAGDALRVIEETSRGTLAEMRQLLGVLRAGTESDVDMAPAPGLAGLPELAKRARMAGVQVELSVPKMALPEGVELSVYRIVQEALTNVVKHAAPARARVVIEANAGEVRVEVSDDGVSRPAGPDGFNGHGLIGMRERVMMYDGTFTAGPRPEGGFAVSASLPYRDAS